LLPFFGNFKHNLKNKITFIFFSSQRRLYSQRKSIFIIVFYQFCHFNVVIFLQIFIVYKMQRLLVDKISRNSQSEYFLEIKNLERLSILTSSNVFDRRERSTNTYGQQHNTARASYSTCKFIGQILLSHILKFDNTGRGDHKERLREFLNELRNEKDCQNLICFFTKPAQIHHTTTSVTPRQFLQVA
jgi:hypothetical protein